MSDQSHLGGYVPSDAQHPHSDDWTYYHELWAYLLRVFSPKWVLDVGCGEGWATKWFLDHGCHALGVDGCPELLKREAWPGQHSHLLIHDFTEPVHLTADSVLLKTDLVWSCEFVEHVEERCSGNFLDMFALGKVVAMTHGLPEQGGHHHVNCQPAEYWIARMADRGFMLAAGLTDESRKLGHHHWRNSGMIFIREDQL